MLKLPDHVRAGIHIEAKGVTKPLVEQVHGNEIVEAGTPKRARELLLSPPKADGLMTNAEGVEIFVFTADCVPLLFFTDRESGPVAAIHCGWRGAAAGIAEAAVERLRPKRGELHVVIGPSIRGCCYHVREDFVEAFRKSDRPVDDFVDRSTDRMRFDLPAFLVKTQLASLGDNVHTEWLRCTFCSQPQLPSFRRNKSADPRIRAWIKKA